MSHTKGPWKTLPEECDRSYIRVRGTVLGRRYQIANVLMPSYEDAREAEETHANARLIAQSPRLLELLRRYIESDKRQGLTGTTLHMEALSAIAEVEGADGVTGYDAPERVKVGELILPGISGEEYDEPEVLTSMKVLEQLQERLVRNGNDRVLDLFVELPAGVDVPRGGEQ